MSRLREKTTATLLIAIFMTSIFAVVIHVSADTLEVGTGKTYTTIQAAINVAGSNDIIVVFAGTYAEDLTIPASKINLELVGAPKAKIKGVQEIEWPTHVSAISILASGVKIHGFTIESPDYSRTTGNPHSSGIAVGAANVEIYDNTFVSTDDGTGNSAGWCTSIETYGGWAGDVSGLNIHDNTFTSETGTDKGSEGIYINCNSNNPDPTGTVTIEDNTFGGQLFRAITTERSRTTIRGNSIRSSYAPSDPPGTVYDAALRGISIIQSMENPNQDTIIITDNTVKGFWQGIHLQGDSLTNIEVEHNTLRGNTMGIRVENSADGIVVNYNNIFGNVEGVVNYDVEEPLDATLNWWGHPRGPGWKNPAGKVINNGIHAWVYTVPFLSKPTHKPSGLNKK